MYKVLRMCQNSEIFHALRSNLAAWFLGLDAGLKLFFHFKLKADHLRLHTSPSALTAFTHFYKPTTPVARTKGRGPVCLTGELSASFKRRESPLAENSEVYA